MKSNIRKITTVGVLCAVAFVCVAVIRIPVVSFLKYEPKDVIIVTGGMIYGPLTAFVSTIIVCLIEMITISDTGLYGFFMNALATTAFACTASFCYKKSRTLKGAVTGLITGTLLCTAIMLLWNFIITPFYMGVSREAVKELLIPVFLPFNLIKCGLNSGLTLLIYKPVVTVLRKSKLIPATENNEKHNINLGVILFGLFIIISCVLCVLLLKK